MSICFSFRVSNNSWFLGQSNEKWTFAICTIDLSVRKFWSSSFRWLGCWKWNEDDAVLCVVIVIISRIDGVACVDRKLGTRRCTTLLPPPNLFRKFKFQNSIIITSIINLWKSCSNRTQTHQHFTSEWCSGGGSSSTRSNCEVYLFSFRFQFLFCFSFYIITRITSGDWRKFVLLTLWTQ